jgi:uncharacterized membrane protein HdeD (DUF308 family)
VAVLDSLEPDTRRGAALRGVAAVVFGVLILVWPGPTVWVFVVAFGVFAFVDGLTELRDVLATPGGARTHRAPVAFRAIVSMLVGVVAFAWPGITALAMLYLIAGWAFAVGVTELVIAARRLRTPRPPWLIGLSGLLAIALAVVLIADPGAGILTITWVVGWLALAIGVVTLVHAWRLRPQDARPREARRPRAVA